MDVKSVLYLICMKKTAPCVAAVTSDSSSPQTVSSANHQAADGIVY